MLIERPPKIFRLLFPGGIFRIPSGEKRGTIYLTFDDGPIPESTPQILDILDDCGVKATFFMVGDNARKYPELLEEVRRRGHSVGNHTMHHLQGSKTSVEEYMKDVEEADSLLNSRLFRPPHGWLRPSQLRKLREKYRIVMYDLVTRDYSRRLTPEDVMSNVRHYSRDGSIIVFHDSLKSLDRTHHILRQAIEWLKDEGYEFSKIE